MVQSPFTKAALALLVGSLVVARTAPSPFKFVVLAVASAVPTFLVIELCSRTLDSKTTQNTTDKIWSIAFFLTLLVIGAGLGMILVSSLGWSRQPERLRYPLAIIAVAIVSLLVGYYSTRRKGVRRGT